MRRLLRRWESNVCRKDFLRASRRFRERRGALNQREAFDVKRRIAARISNFSLFTLPSSFSSK